MKKYLLVSGCSWGDPNFISTEHPDMDTSWLMWPEILAAKLDMKLINLCKSGQGQEYIYSTLIDKLQTIPISQIGLMIPAWSTAPRRDYQMSGFQTRKQLWTADQFDWRGCIEYWIDRSIRYYYSFQSIMELHRIPYRQVQMVHLYTGYMWEELNKRQNRHYDKNDNEDLLQGDDYVFKQEYKKHCKQQILNSPYYNKINKNFIDWDSVYEPNEVRPKNLFGNNELKGDYVERISEKDKHPNENGQRTIAETIYDRLG